VIKTLHLRGTLRLAPLGRRENEHHATILTPLVGHHFDEVIVHYPEGFDAAALDRWVQTRGLTRLRPGGNLIFVVGPTLRQEEA
jgi:hypothetical protein